MDTNGTKQLTEKCGSLWAEAMEEVRRLRHAYVGVEHVFNALIRQQGEVGEQYLLSLGVDPAQCRDAIRNEVGSGAGSGEGFSPVSPRLADILKRAATFAGAATAINAFDLLQAIVDEGESLPVRYLVANGLALESLRQKLKLMDGATVTQCSPEDYDRTLVSSNVAPVVVPATSGPPREYAAPGPVLKPKSTTPVSFPTPTLDQYGRDLTKLARLGKLAEAIGREEEIQKLIVVLARTQKSNPLLLGDAGVGKTAIVEGLAWAIANGRAPDVLRGKRIVEIDFGSLTAGSTLRGQFEARIGEVLKESIQASEVILFIDEIHTIIGAGRGDGAMDAAQMFKPALARGEISCIGATTQDEFSRYIRKDPALERRFSPVTIQKMTSEATLAVLERVVPRIIERQSNRGFQLVVEEAALKAAVSLSDRYVLDRNQPDKAIDAIDVACASAVISGEPRVSAAAVAKVIADWTGIPVERMGRDKLQRFSKMEETIGKKVIGQEKAVVALCRAVRTAMAGLKVASRPIGVFLFVGPSGVGKTKLAKELATFLFDVPDALIRFDMSQYQDKYTVSNLVGSPRGYVGSEKGGEFTEALRRRPYSVVLLDEIEKAHPDVFNIFLPVFDDGRIADADGRVADCSNAVFILTSNLSIKEPFGLAQSKSLDLRRLASEFLRPELVNRITEVVQFMPLRGESLLKILDALLEEKIALFEREHKLRIRVDEKAKHAIIGQGFDPQMGARPLERAVDQMVVQPLVDRLFSGTAKDADILITAQNETLVIESPTRGN